MSQLFRVDPLRQWAYELVRDLDAAARKKDGTCYANPKPHMDKVLASRGGRTRMGDGDEKTASPGTYRAVGNTCPDDCLHHPKHYGSCYADVGNVGVHSKAARGAPIFAAANAFAAAAVWAQLTGRLARIHVSGDFGLDDGDPLTGSTVDWAYVDLIFVIGLEVAARYNTDKVAWTYTAFTGEAGEELVDILRMAGIHVRLSGFLGAGGAITAPFSEVPRLRKQYGVRIAKCPAQLRKVNCADCALCWARPDVCIAFDPHGSKAKRYKLDA